LTRPLALLALAGGLLWPTGVAAQAPAISASAQASKTEVTVGETFTVDVEAKGPAGTTWTFPPEIADDSVELRVRTEARPLPERRTYDAAVFALTDAAVPAIALSYRLPDGTTGQVLTAPVPLQMGTLLSRDPKEREIADIRPPVDIATLSREFWAMLWRALTQSALGAVVLVALAALAYWLWRRRRRRQATSLAPMPVPQTPSDVEAIAALERLAASGRIEREEYRAYYIELTEIAKRYLERRLEAPVLEMTTAETLAFLRLHTHGNAFVDLVGDVAGAADQVKFARGQGARERAESHLGAVRRLVHDLEARLRPMYVEAPPGEGVSSSKRL
jgi:hypothetical protein